MACQAVCARAVKRVLNSVYLLLAGLTICVPHTSRASPPQVTTITETAGAGDLGTRITRSGTTYGITDGTPSGVNLFHSFGEFSVAPGDTALFQTTTLTPDVTVSNILGRVTGGNPSHLFGTIDSATFYPGANLFLMNPAGIVFGPTATLNVGGSVAFTTANYLRLAEADGSHSGIFHVDTTVSNLLTSAPVAAFGFLNPNTGPIKGVTVEGSLLSVPAGQSFSVVGGDITITSGSEITAPSGQIQFTSVASGGEVRAPSLQSMPNIHNESFGAMGNIRIDASALDVSGSDQTGNGRGGMVSIRGGRLVMDRGSIVANTFGDSAGNETAVGMVMTDDISLRNGSSVMAYASGAGKQGNVAVKGQAISLESASSISTLAATSPEQGGNISVESRALTLQDGSNVFTATTGEAASGSISITAIDSVQVFGLDPNLGTPSKIETAAFANGRGGNVAVDSPRVNVESSGQISTVSVGIGRAGNLSISNADTVTVGGGGVIISSGGNGSGTITIQSDDLEISGYIDPDQRSRVSNVGGGEGGTGHIHFDVHRFLLSEDARVNMEGEGRLGKIMIHANESLTVMNGGKIRMENAGIGPKGLIEIDSPRVILNQGIIQTLTVGPGDAGAITILNADDILINGGKIDSSTCFSTCAAVGGFGGDISLSATHRATIRGRFAERNIGGVIEPAGPAGIYSAAGNSGKDAGTITISSNIFEIQDHAVISSMTSGPGSGGDILVKADSIAIKDGSSVSSGSTGPGNAGNIKIDAGRQLSLQDSRITTEARTASGGNIEVIAIDRIHLANGRISTSVREGAGDSGRISIDPKEVIVQNNSTILTQAVHGDGGDIIIATPRYLQDSTSLVDATSQFGRSGRVTIQSSTSHLSGTVTQLTTKPSATAALLQNRCVALAGGEQSTFILAGRDTLPTEPGGWLSSPVSVEHWTRENTEHAAGLMVRSTRPTGLPVMAAPKDETTILSLRRLTPPGFLVRTFATGPTGCRS